MVSIIEALGNDHKTILLEDNESIYGGTAHLAETLKEFMGTSELKETDDYGELCIRLEECGIKAIRPIAHVNFDNLANDVKIKRYNELPENYKKVDSAYYTLKHHDMIYCRKFIDDNFERLNYDRDSGAWFIDSQEVVDELWYEHNTYLHPKELIGWIEEYIEVKMHIIEMGLEEEYIDKINITE